MPLTRQGEIQLNISPDASCWPVRSFIIEHHVETILNVNPIDDIREKLCKGFVLDRDMTSDFGEDAGVWVGQRNIACKSHPRANLQCDAPFFPPGRSSRSCISLDGFLYGTQVQVFSEVCRVLKSGGMFGGYEWVVTDKYDPNNSEHVRLKEGIEVGNGLPTLATPSIIKANLKEAGFEVRRNFSRRWVCLSRKRGRVLRNWAVCAKDHRSASPHSNLLVSHCSPLLGGLRVQRQ